jgi:hypothetical protein
MGFLAILVVIGGFIGISAGRFVAGDLARMETAT